MKKIIICFITFLISSEVYSQVESPPTLALGVAGVLGEKGSIDVEVLAEIISAKQGELKKEFIKKTIFDGLSNKSYTLWEYAYNSYNVLLESKDKEAIKKNLLNNSANLALVYGFAEFYLQLSYKLGNSDLDNLMIKYDSKNYNRDYRFIANQTRELRAESHLLKANAYKHHINESIPFSTFFIDLTYDILKSNKQLTEKLGFWDST